MPGIYLIVLCGPGRNQLEIFNVSQLLQKGYPERDYFVVGIAKGFDESAEILEEIAKSFEGVEKSFAIQAGREIRILVNPEQVDDLACAKMARKIREKIESELTYPGQIKVNVIREVRAQEVAK